MTTMSELHQEYVLLNEARQRLIDERIELHQTGATGAAFQDHAHRTRQYVTAYDAYVEKLRTRRKKPSGAGNIESAAINRARALD